MLISVYIKVKKAKKLTIIVNFISERGKGCSRNVGEIANITII